MKSIVSLLILLSLALPAHAVLMQVTGTFNGTPTSGVASRSLSGSFKANFDDALVAPTGHFTLDNLTLTDLFLSDPVIGATTFDLTNTYLDLGFVDGSLRSFGLGDVTNNTPTFGTDDFSMYYENGGGLILSQMVISEQGTGFYGVDFRFNDASTGSFSVSAVPDSDATALLMAIGCLGLLNVRRRLVAGG